MQLARAHKQIVGLAVAALLVVGAVQLAFAGEHGHSVSLHQSE